MEKKPKSKVSPEHDLETLKKLLADGQLEDTLAVLDPRHLEKSLDRVPVQIIRLLAALYAIPENQQRVDTLRPDQREPLNKLLSLAREHNAEAFVTALIRKAARDEKLARRVGIDLRNFRFPVTREEADIFNTVTRVESVPFLMLKSHRVYADIGFFQENKLLFRGSMEMDEILQVARKLIGTAKSTMEYLQKLGQTAKPHIDVDVVNASLASIQDDMKEFRRALARLPKGAAAQDGGK